jgi:hypothetical protein
MQDCNPSVKLCGTSAMEYLFEVVNHVNKKLLASVSVGVVVAILLLLGLLRLTPLGELHSLASSIVGAALCLLALPMRLYVMFVLGEDGHWSLPVLLFFLMLSGLMWGVIVERVASLLGKRSSAL